MFSTRRRLLGAPVALLLLTIAACQGTRTSTPVTPAASVAEKPASTFDAAQIPASVWEADIHPGQGLIGLNQLVIDSAQQTVQLEPMRMATVSESFDVDMYEYMRQNPCGDCLQVLGLGFDGENVEVNMGIKHPFAFGPKRYDLHLFDVRGTLIPLAGTSTQSGLVSDMGGADTPVSGNFGALQDPDGYSSFFTEQVKPYLGAINPPPVGTIFPFKEFARDLSPSDYVPGTGTFSDLQYPAGHNTFAMGEGFEPGGVTYRINVGSTNGELRFLFLVDAAYGASSTRQTRLSPKYFLPEFHRKDAFRVTMQISGSQLIAGRATDIAQATVTAYDWQGEIPGNPAFSADSAASTIKARSAPESMEFFVPGVTTGAPDIRFNNADYAGDVLPGTYWTSYEQRFAFTNTALAPPGTYYAVVAIRDSMYGTGVPVPVSAVTREFTSGLPPQPLTDITTYMVRPVEVLALPVDCPGPNGPTFTPAVIVTPPVDGTFNQGKNFSFQIDNIQKAPASTATALLRVEMDLDYDNNPFNFAPDGGSVPLTGIGPTSALLTTNFSGLAPIVAATASHRVGFRVIDDFGNCNYTSAVISLWPQVTCPGAYGPSYTFAATNAPQPQGNNTMFSITNLIRGGQTAMSTIQLTFPGYPAVPPKNIVVPGGAEPLNTTFNENFSDPGFGVFAVTTNIQCQLRITDLEGNCAVQNQNIDVNVGAPAPSFDLIQNPAPAEPVPHGQVVQFLIDNILTPSSTILDVSADPNYSNNPLTFNPAISCPMLDPDTYQTSYDWRAIAYLPTDTVVPRNFAVRVRNTSGKETIITEPVLLANNQAPTASWQPSAPTTGATGSAVSITAAMVSGSDPDGSVTSYRISWGDATADFTGTLPTTHTYSSANSFTMTLYARDNGYGPTNGPAPLPTSREGAGVTRAITITGNCPGFWCEDFETTAAFGIPAGWVRQNAISSGGLRYGVKVSAALCTVVGNTHVLEESGSAGVSSTDQTYGANGGTAHAARWGIFSVPIDIPNDALNYTLTVTQRVNYTYYTPPARTCDGALTFVKWATLGTDPGTTETGGGTMAALTATANGPATTFVWPYSNFCGTLINSDGNPFEVAPSMPSLTPAFGQTTAFGAWRPWVNTTYNINSMKGRTIRIYFVHGQTYWDGGCLGSWNVDGAFGHAVDRVQITTS